VWQILFLAQLGVGRNQALDGAVGHLFAHNQREDGAFRASKAQDGTPVGLHGSLLWALETLGYGGRPAVRRAWSWLARRVENHGFGDTIGAVRVLWAVHAVPGDRSGGAVEDLRAAAVAALLAKPPDTAQGRPLLDQLTFPLADGVDALQWLAVLVDAGCGADPSLAWARSWVSRKQLPDGRWPLERVPGKLWAGFGDVGCPNKWVTIRALQAGC
jgi:hypothetical protein